MLWLHEDVACEDIAGAKYRRCTRRIASTDISIEASDSRCMERRQLNHVRLPSHPILESCITANLVDVEFLEHEIGRACITATLMSFGSWSIAMEKHSKVMFSSQRMPT